jgi:hypothetical protein
MAAWQDADGDVLSLTRNLALGFADLEDVDAVRAHCRTMTEEMRAGLVQADVVVGTHGPSVMLVAKRLDRPAFVVTGMLVVTADADTASVWTLVARERGMTGVREAVVTAQMMGQGTLTPETYRTSWARDPYDPTYDGVDQSTLRYLSDDESFDALFPQHPLSKVRRELRKLLAVELPLAPMS